MKKPSKKVLFISTAIISLFIVLYILIPSLINLERYKGRIEGFISGAFNREVFIKKIKPSILRGIGAELRDIRIGRDPELIGIKMMRVRISILPLLRGHIEIKGVLLQNIRIILKREEGKERVIVISKLYLPLTSLSSRFSEFNVFEADLYKGSLIGDLWIERGEGATLYNLNHNIERVELEQLIRDAFGPKIMLSGQLKLVGTLRGAGNNLEGLEGSGKINIGRGKIKGIELADIIGSVGIITTKRPLSLTDYDRISGSYTIRGGYLKTEDLEMLGKDLHLKAKGSYGLVNSKLDFLVKGHIIDIPVEIKIEGTGSRPTYRFKTSGIEKKAIEELGKGLSKDKNKRRKFDDVLKDIFKE